MIKKELEDLLPTLQTRYRDLLDESKRIEGEFRIVQTLINNWQEEEKDQAVNAQAKPSTN